MNFNLLTSEGRKYFRTSWVKAWSLLDIWEIDKTTGFPLKITKPKKPKRLK